MQMRKRFRRGGSVQSWANPNLNVLTKNVTTGAEDLRSETQNPVITDYFQEYCEDVDRKVHPYIKSNRDNGGPFFLKRLTYQSTRLPFTFSGTARSSAITESSVAIDGLCVHSTKSTWVTPSGIDARWNAFGSSNSESALSAYGSKAFNAIDPTQRVLPSASQLLAELAREGLPSLPGRLFGRLKSFRGAGSEYLNYQFGWRSLVIDIQKMLNRYLELEAIISQLRRDNNKDVRRSKVFLNTDVTTTSSQSPGSYTWPGWISTAPYGAGPHSGDGYPSLANYGRLEERVRDKIWCVGKGHYVLDLDIKYPDGPNDIKGLLPLFFQEPLPVTLYELIPWSWLIDWFSNLGDLVQQAFGSGIGTFTADYCYLMRHQVRIQTYSYLCTPRWFPYVAKNNVGNYISKGGNMQPTYSPLQYIITEETKRRIAATPFGFGLTYAGLSPTQAAILAALGLSRQNFI